MNRQDANSLINSGQFTFEMLRDLMRGEFDGKPSKTIRDCTKEEAFAHYWTSIEREAGPVIPGSGYAVTGSLILREFGLDG